MRNGGAPRGGGAAVGLGGLTPSGVVVAEIGFEPMTSGLWAPRADRAAPLR